MLISFEGLDCSGKGTQIKLLSDFLKQKNKVFTILREPGGTEISEMIRNILLDAKHKHLSNETELLLYLAARAQLVSEKIVSHDPDSLIIADRFIDSTIVYQGYGRGLDVHLIETLNQFATREIQPDLTFLLDISPDLSYERRNKRNESDDRIESSGIAFFERVRKGYLELAQKEKRFRIINGEQSADEIHQQILKHLSF